MEDEGNKDEWLLDSQISGHATYRVDVAQLGTNFESLSSLHACINDTESTCTYAYAFAFAAHVLTLPRRKKKCKNSVAIILLILG